MCEADTVAKATDRKTYNVSNFKNLNFGLLAKHFDAPISIAALSLGVMHVKQILSYRLVKVI